MTEAYDWYRRNCPKGPEYDPRLFEVLRMVAYNGQIYNVYRTGRGRNDGGFRPFGDGVAVRISNCLSTFDGGELTALVLSAHHHCCRVQISAVGNYLEVAVTPRTVGAERLYDRHPTLDKLTERIAKRQAVSS